MQVKQNHGLYPKAIIEEALNNAPGGVSIVLKGTAPNDQIGIELHFPVIGQAGYGLQIEDEGNINKATMNALRKRFGVSGSQFSDTSVVSS